MTERCRLTASGLIAGYGGKPVLSGVNVSVPDGAVTALIGANACGKSTLLKALAGIVKPAAGTVELDGKAVASYRPKALAKSLSYLPQTPTVPEGVTVADLASRGRYPHRGFLGNRAPEDDRAIAEALELMGVADIADRPFSELSGGQRQRAWISMAIAQKAEILFLDEPTTYLDVAHQVEILDLLTDLNRKGGITVVMVLHELNLASRYADRIIAMKDGRLIAEGTPTEVMSRALLREAFGIDGAIIGDPVSGTPLIVPRGRHRALDAPA